MPKWNSDTIVLFLCSMHPDANGQAYRYLYCSVLTLIDCETCIERLLQTILKQNYSLFLVLVCGAKMCDCHNSDNYYLYYNFESRYCHYGPIYRLMMIIRV